MILSLQIAYRNGQVWPRWKTLLRQVFLDYCFVKKMFCTMEQVLWKVFCTLQLWDIDHNWKPVARVSSCPTYYIRTDLNIGREQLGSCRTAAPHRESGPWAQQEGHGPRAPQGRGWKRLKHTTTMLQRACCACSSYRMGIWPCFIWLRILLNSTNHQSRYALRRYLISLRYPANSHLNCPL